MNKSTSIAYIDLLTCLFVFFLITFTIVFAQQKKLEASLGNVNSKAEFIITLDWIDESDNDLDLWVKDPLDEVVFFRQKETKAMILNHDDRGMGDKAYPIRREIVTIRGHNPGRYVVNVVMWSKRNKGPERAHVTVIKLNPYQVVAEKTVMMNYERQENTIISFITDNKNNIISKSNRQISLIEGIVSKSE